MVYQTSRASSPDNDFVDVESTIDNRPHSSASVSLLKQSGPQLISPMPEVKRNRGRPRKLKDPSTINDDSKVYRVKRGRGRPRKNSLNSNLSNTQNSYLEEGTSTKFFSFIISFFWIISNVAFCFDLVIEFYSLSKLNVCFCLFDFHPFFAFVVLRLCVFYVSICKKVRRKEFS